MAQSEPDSRMSPEALMLPSTTSRSSGACTSRPSPTLPFSRLMVRCQFLVGRPGSYELFVQTLPSPPSCEEKPMAADGIVAA